MDIRRVFQDPAYCSELCDWLAEKSRIYLAEREALEERDRCETVSRFYSKSGQDFAPLGYYHPGSFDAIVANAVHGRLYKEKPESYAYEYHLNEDQTFIAIHRGPLTVNRYWSSVAYYFIEKDFNFACSISKPNANGIMFFQDPGWRIGDIIYVKKGATKADTEIIELECNVKEQEKTIGEVYAEYCDKIEENLFTCYKRELMKVRGIWVKTGFNVKVELDKQGKLRAVNK